MTEPTPPIDPAAPPAPPSAPPPVGKPWHDGVDAEILGHWQNKGWKTDDPKEIALAATKQAREAEKHFGVPADQLLKMPKADARPEDIKAFWQRLGAPAEAKDYDLSTVMVAGKPLDEAMATSIREAMAQSFVPKDKAVTIASAVAKAIESADTARAAVMAGKLAEEKAALAKDWGANFEFNRLKAMEGARRLGITPEGLNALENMVGYQGAMEAMRKIGTVSSEDTFVERGTSSNGNPTTREGARARLSELESDKAWGKRLRAKDAATVAEWKSLTALATDEAA